MISKETYKEATCMDTFENNDNQYEPESQLSGSESASDTPLPEASAAQIPVTEESPAAQPETSAYHGAGTGRKESPYADSPYVIQPPRNTDTLRQETTQKPKKQKHNRKKLSRTTIAALLGAALVAVSCFVTATLVNMRWDRALQETQQQFAQQISQLEQQIALAENKASTIAGGSVAPGEALSPAQVYAQNVNSVVAISTTVSVPGYFGQTTGSSSGSGFILSEDGYVITNYHVIEGASAVSVITHGGDSYAAKVIGHDSNNDVAILKVEAQGLPAVTMGSSGNLIIGDMVVAIGNPLGELASTQTVGYVSGIGREVSTDGLTSISMIQTDAAINPGNSGGPLFNMKGEVIGITTAKYSGTTTSGASIEGIGFAIPIDDVVIMIDDLIDYGYVTGPYLGVSVQNVDEASAAMYNLPTGAYVVEVTPDVSAGRAGVQVKDIIIDLGGYPVTNVTTLTRALKHFRAGDTTTITVIRSGATLVLDITLDAKPGDLGTVTTEEEPTMPSEGDYEDWYEYFRRYFGK